MKGTDARVVLFSPFPFKLDQLLIEVPVLEGCPVLNGHDLLFVTQPQLIQFEVMTQGHKFLENCGELVRQPRYYGGTPK